jgi:putative tryptophan/tyrosine transport system substrate-binding protein
MRRRQFITLLGGAAATWPLGARAQQPAMPVIGFLSSQSSNLFAESRLRGFRQGLGETGYVEDRNVAIEYRWAENNYDRLPALAADLAQRRVAVIVAVGAVNSVLAAKAASATIPILFQVGSDPIQLGLVTSLARPGGNLTGITSLARELLAKRLEILRELLPNAATIGVLVNPNNPNTEPSVRELQALARAGGWTLHVVAVAGESDFDEAFATLVRLKASAFLHATDQLLSSSYDRMVALAARNRIPGIYTQLDATEDGGLMSYGVSGTDLYRLVGIYAGRILKGEKPADLPVQQGTKVELIVNLKTAKALGIAFPPALLARADEVIE